MSSRQPRDAFLDDLIDGLALSRPQRLVLAQRLGDVFAVAEPVFQGIDGGAGISNREVGVIDAEPFGALLVRGLVGELEIEGCDTGRDDADVKARTLSVINLDPVGDPLLAMP